MGSNSNVPRLNRGLARYETDHFAILGVPLTADSKGIRRGYLQAAKALHPDRFVGDPEGAERANILFAKLVNPANEVLTKERERGEYETVLKMRIKRLLETPPPGSLALWGSRQGLGRAPPLARRVCQAGGEAGQRAIQLHGNPARENRAIERAEPGLFVAQGRLPGEPSPCL